MSGNVLVALHAFRSFDAWWCIHDAWVWIWGSLLAQLVNNLPTVQETWNQSLGGEDSLEKGMASHSSILAWRIPWTKEPWGCKELDMTEQEHTVFLFSVSSFGYKTIFFFSLTTLHHKTCVGITF